MRCAEPDPPSKVTQRIERLQRAAAQIRNWLTRHRVDRRGAKGRIRKRNHTHNESDLSFVCGNAR